MKKDELFERALSAATSLSDTLELCADSGTDLEKIRLAHRYNREAGCALTGLESLLAGNPEPKTGGLPDLPDNPNPT
jgi:hypothetical protein